MKNLQQNWYVRREGRITGPYPVGLVSRYVLLGRIRPNDEVSADRAEWLRVRDVDALVPEVMREFEAHPDDPELQERLKAARRWADERRQSQAPRSDGQERRSGEPVGRGRVVAEAAASETRPRHYLILALLVAAVIAIPFLLPKPDTENVVDCKAPPAPQVNWSGCVLAGREYANADLAGAYLRSADLNAANLRAANLSGSDLAYVNFSRANLRGANLSDTNLLGATLRGADMVNANLRGANLRYAILSGAQLAGADFTGAQLDFAEWPSGVQCLPDSVGLCRME